ncbi:hypothetical protein ACLOJK_000714 [Asimina triloba]
MPFTEISDVMTGDESTYGLGWRGGKWYANRKFRNEQMKLVGQIKPLALRWQSLKGRLVRSKGLETAHKSLEATQRNTVSTLGSHQQLSQSA